MTFTVPHYVPSFFWRFWLSNVGQRHSRQPRLHVYDIYNGDLLEFKSAPAPPRSVFQDLDSALDANIRSTLRHAEKSFQTLESQAEAALSKLIDQTHRTGEAAPPCPSKVSLESNELSSIIKFFVFLRFRNSPKYQEIIKDLVEPSDLSLSISRRGRFGRGETIYSIYSPLYRQVRVVTILTVFTQFFETSLGNLPLSLFSNEKIVVSTQLLSPSSSRRDDPCLKIIDDCFWRCCREVEICLGVPAQEDAEYVLSGSCYGILDSGFGSGTGLEPNPEDEPCDYFFPILPTLALYIINTSSTQSHTSSPTDSLVNIDVDLEMTIDVFLRNAMVLSNVPGDHHESSRNQRRRPTRTFIPYNRLGDNDREEFMNCVSMLRMSGTTTTTTTTEGEAETSPSEKRGTTATTTTTTEVSVPISEEAADSLLDSLEPPLLLPTIATTTTTTTTATTTTTTLNDVDHPTGPKLYFHSLSSLAKSISSYDEFRCRWIADRFIDYSRLKQRCRQKFCMEQVMRVLPVRGPYPYPYPGDGDRDRDRDRWDRDGGSMVVVDLSEEVKLVGREPVAYGAFSDVWKGEWFDGVERKERRVAVKYLRRVMVRKIDRPRLVKRLQAEIITWHQLCHRNLATLFGIIQDLNGVGMVSLWCENGTVTEFLKKYPGKDRLRLVVQIASGVAYLHNFNPPVVHGDLKGNNILIDTHEQAIITDFGLSKVMEDVTSMSSSSSTSNSSPNEDRKVVSSSDFFAGSTRWMAPELIQMLVEDEGGKIPQVTTFSDVYAFGSVCLEIATGQLPYPHRRNDPAVMMDILRGVGPARGAVLSSSQLGIGMGRSTGSSSPSSPTSSVASVSSWSSSSSTPTPTPTSSPRLSHSSPFSSSSASDLMQSSCPCSHLTSSTTTSVNKEDQDPEHDCFRLLLERCWDQVPYLRPSMEDVLSCFVTMEAHNTVR
ncbi:kinase-like protein [Dendrothele bispora CBS 962.96]|uniref:Kinase-like protein n=1 Tax=Dendrothele bispora (strain CBS 962.96) TaxID=1314807 RepID=A0A4S8L6G9_DENBC|nr:kinase-like protein [Dendrothele bispora CBS 962.96]